MADLLPLRTTGGDGSTSLSSDPLVTLPELFRRGSWKYRKCLLKEEQHVKVKRKAMIGNLYNQIPHSSLKTKNREEAHTHKLINIHERYTKQIEWTALFQAGGQFSYPH